jgi:hypothetical protein
MEAPAEREPLPWRLGDLIRLYAALAVGALLVLAAWLGASGTTKLSAQIAWVNAGIGGLIVGAAGIAWWLLTGRRSIGRRIERLADTLYATPSGPAAATRLVAGPRMTRYHRPGCPLVEGKSVRPADEAEHRRAGLRPCGVCAP